jgi:hypothetical protein
MWMIYQLDYLEDFMSKNLNSSDNNDHNLKKKCFDEWIAMKNKRLILKTLAEHKKNELKEKIFNNLKKKNKIEKMINALESNMKRDTYDLLRTLNQLKNLEKVYNKVYKKEFFDKLKNFKKEEIKDDNDDNNDNNVIEFVKIKNNLRRYSKMCDVTPKQKYYYRWKSLVNKRKILNLLKKLYLEKKKKEESEDVDTLKNQLISAIKKNQEEMKDL